MFFKIDFRKEGREREKERNINQLRSICALTRNGTYNLLVYGTMFQPTEPPGQGLNGYFTKVPKKFCLKI